MLVNKHHKTNEDLREEVQQIKLAAQNPKHFDVLYEKYFKLIYVFIYRRTGDEELTADITSQVFLRALVNIKKYQFRGVPFSSWLFRIAFNEVNMFYRKKKVDRIVSIEKIGITQMAEDVDAKYDEETIQKMIDSLSTLKTKEIELIELRYFEERSFSEVGEITGITENNAKVKVYRIIDKLKKLLRR